MDKSLSPAAKEDIFRHLANKVRHKEKQRKKVESLHIHITLKENLLLFGEETFTSSTSDLH